MKYNALICRGAGALLAALFILGMPSCRKHDMRIVTLRVPDMATQQHARIIQDALIQYPGIQSARPDFDARELRVTYNSMLLALKNIEYAVAGAGFDVNDIEADPAAAARLFGNGDSG